MFAFITSLILFADAGHGGGTPWWNFPGFEFWKFLNLTIFVFIVYRLLKKPLSAAFKAKREAIRADLIKAEEEKQAALSALTTVEAKLAGADNEKATIISRAESEAAAEKTRITEQTASDVARVRSQSEAEIARIAQQSKAELRKFSAEESIRLAEEKLKAQITPESDARLVKAGIQSIGGLN